MVDIFVLLQDKHSYFDCSPVVKHTNILDLFTRRNNLTRMLLSTINVLGCTATNPTPLLVSLTLCFLATKKLSLVKIISWCGSVVQLRAFLHFVLALNVFSICFINYIF